jgi:hypothetical protein
VYDMYPWDSAGQGDYPPAPLRSRRKSSPARETSPARAIQAALDRRDNGGDTAAAATPPATGPAATPPAAGPAATPLAAGPAPTPPATQPAADRTGQ